LKSKSDYGKIQFGIQMICGLRKERNGREKDPGENPD
jgi:hypothetical protein